MSQRLDDVGILPASSRGGFLSFRLFAPARRACGEAPWAFSLQVNSPQVLHIAADAVDPIDHFSPVLRFPLELLHILGSSLRAFVRGGPVFVPLVLDEGLERLFESVLQSLNLFCVRLDHVVPRPSSPYRAKCRHVQLGIAHGFSQFTKSLVESHLRRAHQRHFVPRSRHASEGAGELLPRPDCPLVIIFELAAIKKDDSN